MQTPAVKTLPTKAEAAGLYSELLNSGAAVRIQVTGSSMRPLIRSGDRVSIRRVPISALQRGDIVWFINTDGQVMAHRILSKHIRTGKVYFHTKGDAQFEYDPWTPAEKILGKIYQVEKNRADRPTKILNLETPGWQIGGRLIALVQIALSKVVLGARSRIV